MTWKYRVIKTEDRHGTEYKIHEVYYNDEGHINGWSLDAVSACGENYQELLNDLTLMTIALMEPVLIEVNGKLNEVPGEFFTKEVD